MVYVWFTIIALVILGGIGLWIIDAVASYKRRREEKTNSPLQIRIRVAEWENDKFVATISKKFGDLKGDAGLAGKSLQTKIKNREFMDELVWLAANNLEDTELLLTLNAEDQTLDGNFLFEKHEDATNCRLAHD